MTRRRPPRRDRSFAPRIVAWCAWKHNPGWYLQNLSLPFKRLSFAISRGAYSLVVFGCPKVGPSLLSVAFAP